MIVLKNVLVATDFSPASDAALAYARALARTFGASLHLLHVAENQFLRPAAADPATIKTAQLRSLNERLTAADRDRLGAVAVLEVSDTPADAIVEYARRATIDLAVIGTHGRSGMSQILVGSVAERVVRTAPCPVLTVRHPEREFLVPDCQSTEAATILLKNILVATDFSKLSEAALAYGRALAHTFDAQLTVLHVAENIAARGYAGDTFLFVAPELQRDVEAAAHKQTDLLVSDDDRAARKADAVVLTSNSPASAIADYAGSAAVDLIVIGTHGRGAVAHLLMGSVAERVVRTAPCPVLTIRQPEHEFVLPDAFVAVTRV
jgi:nucleotide-binding universal stress UspA family protein